MRRFGVLLPALFLTGLILAPELRAAPRAAALFQDAMIKETGERDLEGAADLYRQVVEQAGSDKLLASKARLRMASCYERLGKVGAAELAYLEVLNETATPSDLAQMAQSNLQRIQTRKTEDAAKSKPMVVVRQFQATRWSLSAGPGWARSGADSLGNASLALRYRVSSSSRPFALFLEGGALLPVGNSSFPDQTRQFNSQTTDTASLKLRYQVYFAGVAELPHGRQRTVIPEMGIGAALTASEIQYTSGDSGTQTSSTWSPYLSGGLHFFADHRVSLILQGAYIANPYPKSIQIAVPAHTQTFDFPSSLWTIGAKVQLKIGSTKHVLRSPK